MMPLFTITHSTFPRVNNILHLFPSQYFGKHFWPSFIPSASMGRGPELSPQLRSRLCELRSLGFSYSRIHSHHPEVPLSTIKYTCIRERQRDDNKSRPRAGAPRKLTEEHKKKLVDLIQENPRVTFRELLDAVDNAVKEGSLRSILRKMHIRKRICIQK